jgi:hypothetical protein
MITNWVFYVFLFVVLAGIIAAIYAGAKHRKRKVNGSPEEKMEGKLCEDGVAAPNKEKEPDSTLPVLLEAHFTLEEGRYRIGNHWLHEGITSDDIAMLCHIVNWRWGVVPEGLRCFYIKTNNGDLIALDGIFSKCGVIINKNVQPGYARFTLDNFAVQVQKARQVKP